MHGLTSNINQITIWHKKYIKKYISYNSYIKFYYNFQVHGPESRTREREHLLGLNVYNNYN